MVKNLPAMRETRVRSLGWKIPWRRAWQPTPVFLPGESPWTEEPGGLQSMGSQRVGRSWATKHTSFTLSLSNHYHVARVTLDKRNLTWPDPTVSLSNSPILFRGCRATLVFLYCISSYHARHCCLWPLRWPPWPLLHQPPFSLHSAVCLPSTAFTQALPSPGVLFILIFINKFCTVQTTAQESLYS